MKRILCIAFLASASLPTFVAAMLPDDFASDYQLVLLNKYADPDEATIAYADVHELRNIFKAELPEETTIYELQKRYLACCMLQELRDAQGHDYSDTRATLAQKMNLFFSSQEDTQKALMFLSDEPTQAKNASEYNEKTTQIKANIERLTEKRSAFEQPLEQTKQNVTELKQQIAKLRALLKQSQESLVENKIKKTELEEAVLFHTLADKILHERQAKTETSLERFIKQLEQDIKDIEANSATPSTINVIKSRPIPYDFLNQDVQIDTRTVLTQLKQELKTAKKALAHSKGEETLFGNLFGY